MRTIRPPAHDLSFTVELLNVSYQGHVIFTGHNQENHSLHVFTLNGRHLASANLTHRVTGTDIGYQSLSEETTFFFTIFIFRKRMNVI